MRKRSVVIIGTRGYPSFYGGFETAVRHLAPYLVEHGWDVTVYGRPGQTTSEGGDPRVRQVLTGGIERKSLSTLSYGLTAARHAARRRPDAALVMNVANGFWLPILKRRGIPTVVNVDGIEWERAKWSRLGKAVFRRGAVATAKHADRIVVDAHEIGRRWRDDFGVEGDFIPYGGDVPEPLPVENGLDHRGYALAVARFVPENTVPEFLAAAEMIARHRDVVIVGSSGYGGELDEKAAALARSNSRVRWLGHLSDDRRLFALWQHSGAYFHGHSVGGTNPALVQAMACGAPIVARDTVYNREVLAEAGRFTAPDPIAIADSVLELLDHPSEQERLSVAALARARSNYSWAGVCAGYEASLLTAIGADGETTSGRSRTQPISETLVEDEVGH